MTLIQHLRAGAVLRYRQGFGFYVVRQGKTTSVNQAEAEQAIRAGRVRPESKQADKFGVFHFALTNKETA
ncbi:hypothetical protein [Delftia tsuruhatensis]|uniref:hypothetical protein n=1 Tax=Delftia tsuruhatensis TaxID=180282 RepID=UPI0022610032|nr:hypothetical protein [Delftia tsuruhatensis]MCX7509441.1 hypothetical protein [Delftia tsuruhatensis]